MPEEKLKRVFRGILGDVKSRPAAGCSIDAPGPFCLVVFGASGDLAQRKIIPALYRLFKNGLLSEQHAVIGAARSDMTDQAFRSTMREAVRKAEPGDFEPQAWKRFAERLCYHPLSYDRQEDYASLKKRIAALEKKFQTAGNRIFYLAVPPVVYETVISRMGAAGLSQTRGGYVHVVIEKPIGSDLASARHLNEELTRVFTERQIYRMDHYLAKETVQNILMFRFANSIFEPLWNRRYIDHVQITVSETVGVEHRAGYYEKAGVIRDMFQNHIFQLLALTAMEPPSAFDAERVRDEKVKVFRSVRPFNLSRPDEIAVVGQYGEGKINGKPVVAYRKEPGVDPRSAMPTYCAMRVLIDNWRWNGVPFYLRSGKRLSVRKAEISVHFRPVPHLLFAKDIEERIDPNVLVLRIQPDEGISVTFQAKVPGSKVCLEPVVMNFSYERVFALEAYERVLLDCMQGDQMLFVRGDGVEETWALLTPLIAALESRNSAKRFPNYAAGTAGPADADALPGRDGKAWRPL